MLGYGDIELFKFLTIVIHLNILLNLTVLTHLIMLTSQTLEVRFTAFNMTALDDPDHLSFEATYEFIKLPLLCKEVKRLSGTSGIINIADEKVRVVFLFVILRANVLKFFKNIKFYRRNAVPGSGSSSLLMIAFYMFE